MSLATLVPGTGQSGTNINGGRSGSQNSGMANVRLDGALNVDNVFQQILPTPSPDAVQEFTTQVSSASAKYGFAAGVIEVTTKSGTNDLHGAVYEFLRNMDLDARNFFCPPRQTVSETSTALRSVARSGFRGFTTAATAPSGLSTSNSKRKPWAPRLRSLCRRRRN